jgi:hypothetical protein
MKTQAFRRDAAREQPRIQYCLILPKFCSISNVGSDYFELSLDFIATRKRLLYGNAHG